MALTAMVDLKQKLMIRALLAMVLSHRVWLLRADLELSTQSTRYEYTVCHTYSLYHDVIPCMVAMSRR